MLQNTFYIICHNIRSLYNVGSIFRTSDAFGADKIILTGYTGTPKNPKLEKTALGAEKLVAWEYKKQLKRVIQKLKKKGFQIVALENNVPLTLFPPPLTPPSPFAKASEDRQAGGERNRGERFMVLNKFKPKFPLALLLGEEVKGTKPNYLKLCDKIVEIPMKGKKESLNVSVAFGIAVHHIDRFRNS